MIFFLYVLFMMVRAIPGAIYLILTSELAIITYATVGPLAFIVAVAYLAQYLAHHGW